MPDNSTKNDKGGWDYKTNNYLKTKWVLKNNLRNLLAVLMALC